LLTLPPCEDTFAKFAWGSRSEVQGTAAAISFVREQLSVSGVHFGTDGYKLFGLHNQPQYLDTVISGKYALKGTSDVAIAPYHTVEAYSAFVACVLIEFKTTAQFENDNTPQLLAETMALRCLSCQPSVLCVLTDLNDGAFVAKTAWNDVPMKTIVEVSNKVTVSQMYRCIADFLCTSTVPEMSQIPMNPELPYDPVFEPAMQMKKLLKRKRGDSSSAVEQYEELAEGTLPFSRERALAVRHLFQSYGFDEMPRCLSSDYTQIYS
jgi:hypothetical protein